MLTKEDYNNILALINRCDLKGNEATAVAVLQQKLSKLMKEFPVEETSDDKDDKGNRK